MENNKDIGETSEVTDMLVDAIKAKLAILEGIWKEFINWLINKKNICRSKLI